MRRALCTLAAIVLAAVPASAQAASPPLLTGESFSALGGFPYGGLSLTCSTTEEAETYRFRADSVPSGPYGGTYTETGEVVVRQAPNFDMEVVSAQAEFTIDSPAGQVTGTKRLTTRVISDPGNSECIEPRGLPALDIDGPLPLSYTATITTSDGVFQDRGSSTMEFDRDGLRQPTEFHEQFTSSLVATEQEHSVLFGKRRPGSSFSAMSANTKRASPFVFYFPGTVRRIHAFIDGKGATSGSQTVRAVLYRRDPATGGPGASITRSFAYTVPAGMSARWVPFWLAPTAQLQPGVYWLGLQTGGAHGVARYAWDSVPNARRYNIDAFADGASDPFGTSFSDDQQLSIFAFGSY